MSNASFFDSCFEPLLRQTKCTFFQLGQFMAKEQNATLFQIVCQVNRLWKTLHKKCFFSVREFAENWRAKRHRLVHDHFRCGIPWMRNEMTPLILSVSLQFWLVGVQFASVLIGRRAVRFSFGWSACSSGRRFVTGCLLHSVFLHVRHASNARRSVRIQALAHFAPARPWGLHDSFLRSQTFFSLPFSTYVEHALLFLTLRRSLSAKLSLLQ